MSEVRRNGPGRAFRAGTWASIVLLCLAPLAALAEPPKVSELLAKDLPELPGKEVVMLRVEYPPGGSDPIHRHDAHAYVYVLEGSVVMQVKGGPSVTLGPGQTFYEAPDDVHIVGRNASDTKAASFVVLLIKKKGAPALEVVK